MAAIGLKQIKLKTKLVMSGDKWSSRKKHDLSMNNGACRHNYRPILVPMGCMHFSATTCRSMSSAQ